MWNKLVRLDEGLKGLKEGQVSLAHGVKEGPQGLKEGQPSLDAKLDAKVDLLRAELAHDRLYTLGVVGLGGMALYAILKPPR